MNPALHGYIRTFTGRRIDPANVSCNDIDIFDIAHALSMQCRWGGHVQTFYSVAEHCCHVSDELARRYPAFHRLHFDGLLHDAPEAYLVDLPRPLKRRLPGYEVIEDVFALAIGIQLGAQVTPLDPRIREVDDGILHDERLQLMRSEDPDWAMGREPLGITLSCWGPPIAEAEFLRRFSDLARQV